MSILIDPEKAQVDATRELANQQARLAYAQEEANRLKELELLLATMTKEEQKAFLLKREQDKEKANILLVKIVIGIVILITLYVWLK